MSPAERILKSSRILYRLSRLDIFVLVIMALVIGSRLKYDDLIAVPEQKIGPEMVDDQPF